MTDTILTLANGKGLDLLDPKAANVDWPVIAEQLAKENRFNGATPGAVYSVAQHSVMVADEALRETGDAILAAYLLLHDGHEAALKDDTTPKKRALAHIAEQRFGVLASAIMQSFALLTDRHDVAIHEAAGLAWPPTPNLQREIKRFDLRAFVTEWRDLMRDVEHPHWGPYANVPAFAAPIVPLADWRAARDQFLDRCCRLLPALKVAP